MINLLFICSRNKWRSLTAETIFKNHPDYIVKSAGTEVSARVKLTRQMLEWADVVFVMEKHHREKINERYAAAKLKHPIVILEIPDIYKYMDAELIEEIKMGVQAWTP